MVTRRRLIKDSTLGLLSLTALARQARALGSALPRGAGPAEAPAGADPHFFVFVQMQGAWDVCLAFDPKDRNLKMPDGSLAFDQPYDYSEVQTFGRIPLAPHGSALGPYADRLAIINGIDMEIDNGHVADTVMSGALMPKATNVPCIQALLTKRQPYMHACVLPHVYAGYDGNFFSAGVGSTVIASPTDLVAMLGVDAGGSSRLGLVQELVTSYNSGLAEAAERFAFAPYVDAVPHAMDLTTKLKNAGFKAPADATTPEGMGQLFGQLFGRGIAAAVSWELGFTKYDFDTHSDHYAQHPLHFALADVATLMKQLQQIPLDANTSVGDRTTFIMASEFCRTPRLNGSAGKDHHTATNSLALMGYRVKAGVYGASGTRSINGADASHVAMPVDLATGQPAENGHILKIRDVWAGLGPTFGTDLSRDFGEDAKPITFLG